MAGLFICDIRGECGDGVHYRTSSYAPVAVAHRDGLAELPQWLNADAPLDLSFTKLSTIGSALQMPFGALVRSVVPEAREDELIRYRTINNQGVEASRNLRDTIVTMRNRQDWARDEMIAQGVGGESADGQCAVSRNRR